VLLVLNTNDCAVLKHGHVGSQVFHFDWPRAHWDLGSSADKIVGESSRAADLTAAQLLVTMRSAIMCFCITLGPCCRR
jgi:hypothetical protein